MPPNLGGFFMVRSYYPSECHADYFDFERIEALKPAIEACGISTLSQSPMLGFHKQMDNRIKLLEEILSFRMQGVEFDNGDMYVDGHKAASDVRDEFVSVTEKLMDELAQCYNVLPKLDSNNTIDHRPEGDEKWCLENEKTVTYFFFNDTATTEIYTLSLHDALPICYAPSYVSPAYHLLEGFPFIQEPPSGDLQERVLIRHHDYDQCFQSVQLLQWNSQVKFNVTVYRNLP